MTKDTLSILRSISGYLESWARFHAEFRGASGIQLSVAYKGEPVLDMAYGLANVQTGEPLSTEHLFRVASHSKTMTALMVMREREQGHLRLDDTVAEHVEELAEYPVGRATVREVLGHQAGIIRDSSDGDFWQLGKPFLGREELLAVLRAEGDVFEPNEHFKYTNVGYSLLGLVLESASGKSYEDLAREAIVEPLGLRDTGPEPTPEVSERLAAGHTGRTTYTDERRVIPHVDTRAMAPATGWYSRAAEMTRYASAHVMGNETVISDASKRLMQRPETIVTVRGKEIGRYGLGLALGTIGKRHLVGHSGGYPGHSTLTWIDPEDSLVVSALGNSIDAPVGAIAEGVIKLIDLALAGTEEERQGPADLGGLLGRYANLWNVFDVVDLGGVVYVVHPKFADPAQAHGRLDVGAEGELSHEAVDGYGTTGEPVRVVRNTDGSVDTITLGAMTAWPIESYREILARVGPEGLLRE